MATNDLELARLTTLCIRGVLDEDEYLVAKIQVVAEKAELVAKAREPGSGRHGGVPQCAGDSAPRDRCPRHLRNGSPAERRELMAQLCESLVLTEDRLTIQLHRLFAILAGQHDVDDERKGSNPAQMIQNSMEIKENSASQHTDAQDSDGIPAPRDQTLPAPHESPRASAKTAPSR